jgi:hypothetical protein
MIIQAVGRATMDGPSNGGHSIRWQGSLKLWRLSKAAVVLVRGFCCPIFQIGYFCGTLVLVVDDCRGRGRREIGDDGTQHATWQRSGRPTGPCTTKPVSSDVPAGAADQARALFGDLLEARWEEARQEFDDHMHGQVDADQIAHWWTHETGSVGSPQGMDEPLARQVGKYTAVKVPLIFSAGDGTGRVALDPDGKVAGLSLQCRRRRRLGPMRVGHFALRNPEVALLIALGQHGRPGRNSRTLEEVADAAWVESVGGVATPLLGGFSLASVIVVSDDAAMFRWPGLAILALTLAAVVLIAAVQFAQVARRCYKARADLPTSGRRRNEQSDLVPKFTEDGYDERAEALHQAQWMSKWTRRLYHWGIVALLLGLALALAPKQGGIEGGLRWLAVATAAVVLILQVKFRTNPHRFGVEPAQLLLGTRRFSRRQGRGVHWQLDSQGRRLRPEPRGPRAG